jgi:hypothetical protein
MRYPKCIPDQMYAMVLLYVNIVSTKAVCIRNAKLTAIVLEKKYSAKGFFHTMPGDIFDTSALIFYRQTQTKPGIEAYNALRRGIR